MAGADLGPKASRSQTKRPKRDTIHSTPVPPPTTNNTPSHSSKHNVLSDWTTAVLHCSYCLTAFSAYRACLPRRALRLALAGLACPSPSQPTPHSSRPPPDRPPRHRCLPRSPATLPPPTRSEQRVLGRQYPCEKSRTVCLLPRLPSAHPCSFTTAAPTRCPLL